MRPSAGCARRPEIIGAPLAPSRDKDRRPAPGLAARPRRLTPRRRPGRVAAERRCAAAASGRRPHCREAARASLAAGAASPGLAAAPRRLRARGPARLSGPSRGWAADRSRSLGSGLRVAARQRDLGRASGLATAPRTVQRRHGGASRPSFLRPSPSLPLLRRVATRA